MMKSVQQQKIRQTIELIFKYYHEKNEFMKQNIPIQQQLIRKLQQTANLSINAIAKLQLTLKQEKDAIIAQSEAYEKMSLHNIEQFKIIEKANQKNQNQQQVIQVGPTDWNKNVLRVLQAMSVSHIVKQNTLKNYHKLIDQSYQALSTQTMKYRVDIKNFFKELNTIFENIDLNEKQENKILTKLSKQLKSKDFKQSIYYLSQIKKAQSFLIKQISSFAERNRKILQLMRAIFKNQKASAKKLKQTLTFLYEKKKQIFKPTPQDQKLLGMIAIFEQGVQQSREQYLQKTLVSKQMQQRMAWLVKPTNTKLQHVIRYLSIQAAELLKRYQFFTKIKQLGANISFKNFIGLSLASGWLITSYTPCIAYLTFDNFLAIFDLQGTLLKKIHSSNTKINKVDGDAVFLQQFKKGFFTDSKQQYKLKFDNGDRMEEFILFIENQIS